MLGGALIVQRPNRRTFLQTTAGALGFGMNAIPRATQASTAGDKAPAFPPNQTAPAVASNDGKKPLRLGLIIAIGKDPGAAIAKVRDLGLPSCQVSVGDFDPKDVAPLRRALDQNKVEATSCVVGGPGREVWDFYDGPLTIGLVPRDTRATRIAHLKKASDFARQCGIPAVQTHCGFIPENPNDPIYKEAVAAMREVAEYCKGNGQNFRYETGQETPITLVRAMRDVGLDNQGVNFDLANLFSTAKRIPSTPSKPSRPTSREFTPRTASFPAIPANSAKKFPSAKAKWIFR
jgi:L-ribulose-5-phosphate 3-epimerase